MLIKRMTVVTALCATAFIAGAASALADDGWGNTDCSQLPNPGCELGAGTYPRPSTPQQKVTDKADTAGDQSLGSNELPAEFACRYVELRGYRAADPPPEPGAWYMVRCSPDGKDPLSHGPVFLPRTETPQPTVSPAEVAEVARNQLRLPQPEISANPAGDQLVNLPTWLWLSNWESVSASASVPGVSVTAVAKPTSVTWSMGDGTPVRCDGPGTPFRPGGDPRAASPDCGHTYRTSSAGQPDDAYPVSATITWTVSWSGAGESGTFPGITTTSSATFRVAESQGITTG